MRILETDPHTMGGDECSEESILKHSKKCRYQGNTLMECDNFGIFVSESLKSLDSHTVQVVMAEIRDIISKYRLDYVQNSKINVT